MAIPTNFQESLSKANTLKQAGKYSEAASIYEALLPTEIRQSDFFLISALNFCYQRLDAHSKIIQLCKPLYEAGLASEPIKISMAWAIYGLHFKKNIRLEPEAAIEHLETIKKLYPQTKGLHPLCSSILKYLGSDIIKTPAYKCQALEMLNPELLSNEGFAIPNTDKVMASDLESYYSQYSKALLDDQQYYQCIQICQTALKTKLSHGQDVWFQRRIALSLAKSGSMAEAYELFQKIIQKKPEWYILYETALAAYRLHDNANSEKYALQAATAFGKIEAKIHLWELLKDLFSQNKRFDDAILLLKLIAAIKHQMHWNIKPNLMQELASYHLTLDALPPFKELFNSLKKLIQPPDKTSDKNIGTISKLLNNNSSGFISSGNKTYYFRANDCKMEASRIAIGIKVSFSLVESFDQKKQQNSVRAVSIRQAT